MQSSSTFIRISGPILKVKKSALINENIIAYSEESEQSEVQANKCGLSQVHLEGLRVSAFSGKFDYFYSHLSLKKVFSALKLIQNYFINVNIFFFLKTGNLILNWIPLSFSYNHTMPERLYSQSILPNYLVNWEQFGI